MLPCPSVAVPFREPPSGTPDPGPWDPKQRSPQQAHEDPPSAYPSSTTHSARPDRGAPGTPQAEAAGQEPVDGSGVVRVPQVVLDGGVGRVAGAAARPRQNFFLRLGPPSPGGQFFLNIPGPHRMAIGGLFQN